MKNRIKKSRSFGLKVVKYSPWEALLLSIMVLVGSAFINYDLYFIAAFFIVGMVSSPLLIKQYRTGSMGYAAIFGGAMGLAFPIIFPTTRAYENVASTVTAPLYGLYGALCLLFGVSVVFLLFRKRLIIYISKQSQSTDVLT